MRTETLSAALGLLRLQDDPSGLQDDPQAATISRCVPRAAHSGRRRDHSNFVEHPEVVARRIEEAVSVVGDRERVIASTDCSFGTFTKREWVIEPVVWLELKSVREGADIASQRLWGKKVA